MANWRDRGVDAIVGATIFIATLAYLALWPRDFYVFDEGLFLYEGEARARRAGHVPRFLRDRHPRIAVPDRRSLRCSA
jgi:hypothetical protein